MSDNSHSMMFGVDEDKLRSIPLSKENPDTRFETLNRIGMGAFGSVYRCQDRATGEIVAVKQIAINHDEDLDKVAKEITIMKALNHKNIVGYRDAYSAMSSLWISMEYCSGGSVDNIFKRLKQPIPERVIAYLSREILLGLVFLHNNKTIHRDIKCGNVLIDSAGKVKLADFGISAQLTRTVSRRQHTGIGTFHWMAPEAIAKDEYDGKADCWALGISCIEMAEMEPPCLSFSLPQLMSHIVNHPAPTLQNKGRWSVHFHKFLARCLTKDPALRPSAAELLSDPFIVSCVPVNPEQEVMQLVLAANAAAEAEQQQQEAEDAERRAAENPDEDNSSVAFASARSGGGGGGGGAIGAAGRYASHHNDSDLDDDGELVPIGGDNEDSLIVAHGASETDLIDQKNRQQQQQQLRREGEETDEGYARMRAMEEEFDDEIVMNAGGGGGASFGASIHNMLGDDGDDDPNANSGVMLGENEDMTPTSPTDATSSPQHAHYQSLQAFERDLMKMLTSQGQQQQQQGDDGVSQQQQDLQQWYTHMAGYLDGVPPVPVLTADEFSLDEIVRATHLTCLADDDETANPLSTATSYQYPVTTGGSTASGKGDQRSTSADGQQRSSSQQQQQQNGSGTFAGNRPTWTCFTPAGANCPSQAQLMALLGHHDDEEAVGSIPPPPPGVPTCGITHTTETLLKMYGMLRNGVFEDVATKERALRAHTESEKLGSLLKTLMNVQ